MGIKTSPNIDLAYQVNFAGPVEESVTISSNAATGTINYDLLSVNNWTTNGLTGQILNTDAFSGVITLGSFSINAPYDASTVTAPNAPSFAQGTGNVWTNDIFVDWFSSKPSDVASYVECFWGSAVDSAGTYTSSSPRRSNSFTTPGGWQTNGTSTGGIYDDYWPIVSTATTSHYCQRRTITPPPHQQPTRRTPSPSWCHVIAAGAGTMNLCCWCGG